MTCPCPHDMAATTDTCCCTEDCKKPCVTSAVGLAPPKGLSIKEQLNAPQAGKLVPPGTILKSVTVFQYLQGDPSLVVAEEMMDGTVWAYATTKSGNQRVLNYQNMKTLLDTMPATWSKMYHREVREEFQPRS